jgi:membrane associated rhomboid family serine protease
MFYTNATGGRIFYIGTPILSFLANYFLGTGAAGFTLSAVILLGVIIVLGDQEWWGEKKVAAVWMIAAWVGLRDALPGVLGTFNGSGAGIEHWANIGGFLCGASYALLIGSHKEGKTEYLVEEARDSLDKKANAEPSKPRSKS